MRVWALVSQKGGSGKSTIATHLAVYATECGERVCIVDLDPQGSAATWYELRGGESPGAIQCLPEKLGKVIEAAETMGITMVIVDTAPHSDGGAVEAIRKAGLVICPTQPSLFDVAALKDTVRLLDLCESRGKAIGVVNGLPHQGAKESLGDASLAVEGIGLRVCPASIGHRRPFSTAISAGKGVTEAAPKDKAASEIRELWKHLNTLDPITTKKAKKEPVK